MKEKRFIIRYNSFTTNSSSDHSVYVSTEGLDLDKIDIKFYPELRRRVRNGVLTIPCSNADMDYTSQGISYNEIIDKILYCIGVLLDHNAGATMPANEYEDIISPVTNVLKKYLKVDEVIYEWDKDYDRQIRHARNQVDLLECFRDLPIVDWQSRESSKVSIFESEDTLAYFIFNKNSYVFTLYDGCDKRRDELASYHNICNPISLSTPDAVAEVTILDRVFKWDLPVFPICNFFDDINTVMRPHKENNDIDCYGFTISALYEYEYDPEKEIFIKEERDFIPEVKNWRNCGFVIAENTICILFGDSRKYVDSYTKFKKEGTVRSYDIDASNKLLESIGEGNYKLLPLTIHINEFNTNI